MTIEEVAHCIEELTREQATFWSNAEGWASAEAVTRLNQARLDWQVSLAANLCDFLDPADDAKAVGSLVISWTILGSLVEGALKLFLTVYYKDYKSEIEALRSKSKLKDPGILVLEHLRQFFAKKVWTKEFNWDKWIQYIQYNRNAIHAFVPREVGTHEEFIESLRTYLVFLKEIDQSLPYPAE